MPDDVRPDVGIPVSNDPRRSGRRVSYRRVDPASDVPTALIRSLGVWTMPPSVQTGRERRSRTGLPDGRLLDLVVGRGRSGARVCIPRARPSDQRNRGLLCSWMTLRVYEEGLERSPDARAFVANAGSGRLVAGPPPVRPVAP
jgi:hypothetical protein